MNTEIENIGQEEESLVFNLEKYQEAVVWNTDWTVETIINQTSKGNIDLNPNFQRRDAWDIKAKSKLIESLMIGIPVPPIILAEKKDSRGKYIVLDGKQRLLTINQFFSKNNNTNFDNSDFNNFKLKSLEFLPDDLNNKDINDLENDDSFAEYLQSVENQPIRTVVIKNWPDESYLYSVFLRLNTGSKPLSAQELRQALIPGPFLSKLDEKTADSETIRTLLSNKGPDSRMRDVELTLRFISFYKSLEKYDGKLKIFLDNNAREINRNWKTEEENIDTIFKLFERSISLTFEIFTSKSAFSRFIDSKYSNALNRPIIDVLSYLFTIDEVYASINNNKELFKQKFEEINSDSSFQESVASSTNDVNRVVTRFNFIINIINDIQPHLIPFKLIVANGKINKEVM